MRNLRACDGKLVNKSRTNAQRPSLRSYKRENTLSCQSSFCTQAGKSQATANILATLNGRRGKGRGSGYPLWVALFELWHRRSLAQLIRVAIWCRQTHPETQSAAKGQQTISLIDLNGGTQNAFSKAPAGKKFKLHNLPLTNKGKTDHPLGSMGRLLNISWHNLNSAPRSLQRSNNQCPFQVEHHWFMAGNLCDFGQLLLSLEPPFDLH